MTDPDVAERAEVLARAAADRAAQLAIADAEKAQALAVARAEKDVNIARDLREHGERLDGINGSQQKMAASLANVEAALVGITGQLTTQAAVGEALTTAVAQSAKRTFSRRTLVIAGAAALIAFLTLVLLLIDLVLTKGAS